MTAPMMTEMRRAQVVAQIRQDASITYRGLVAIWRGGDVAEWAAARGKNVAGSATSGTTDCPVYLLLRRNETMSASEIGAALNWNTPRVHARLRRLILAGLAQQKSESGRRGNRTYGGRYAAAGD